MNNPKTTIIGFIMIAVVLIYMAYGFYIGKPMGMDTVLAALVGIGAGGGLIAAKDYSTHSTIPEVNNATVEAAKPDEPK
jgi:hypothetical protein